MKAFEELLVGTQDLYRFIPDVGLDTVAQTHLIHKHSDVSGKRHDWLLANVVECLILTAGSFLWIRVELIIIVSLVSSS